MTFSLLSLCDFVERALELLVRSSSDCTEKPSQPCFAPFAEHNSQWVLTNFLTQFPEAGRNRNSPWYVIEPAADGKHPLVQCFECLKLLAVKVEQTLSMKWRPAYEKCDDDGSYGNEIKIIAGKGRSKKIRSLNDAIKFAERNERKDEEVGKKVVASAN